MRLHVLSDLHLERGGGPPPVVADADVLVLAGDIGPGTAGLEAAAAWAPAGQPVLYVSGNHEPYGGALPEITGRLRIAAAADDRLRVLERDEHVLGGVRFLGCTLWSDFAVAGDGAERERAKAICRRIVNDYTHIGWAPEERRLDPDDTVRLHATSRRWLEARLDAPFDGPTVVVTHHAPLGPSEPIADPLRRAIAGAFVSDLAPLMGAGRAALWVFGHTHRRVDVEVAGTRVLSNPRGYPHEPVAGFDPALVVEV